MTDRRPFGELVRIALLLILIWSAVAVFDSSQTYRMAVDTNYFANQHWVPIICNNLTAAFNWALFTPFVVFLAERLPLVTRARWRNAAVLLALTPLLSTVRAAFGSLVLQLGEGGAPFSEIVSFTAHSIDVRFHRNVFLVVVIIGVVNLMLAHRAAAASEQKDLALKKELANAELQRLRTSLQPRFLFAALEAAEAEVIRAPLVADQMVVCLGTVLRRMLDFEKRSDVALGEELAVLDGCLELERKRTGGRFTTQFVVAEELLGARVPPLLLEGAVESALMGDDREPGHLAIDAWQEDGRLRIDIRNSEARRAPSEAAVETMRARLHRAFPERGRVERRAGIAGIITSLTMPLELRPRPVGASRHWTFLESRAQ